MKNQLITKPNILEKYPETLTINQFDNIKWDFEKQFREENYNSTHEACQAVFDFIIKHGSNYVMYTAIDSENKDGMLYDRGNHLCNRIGIWEVVKCMEIEK